VRLVLRVWLAGVGGGRRSRGMGEELLIRGMGGRGGGVGRVRLVGGRLECVCIFPRGYGLYFWPKYLISNFEARLATMVE
jgi:hypothetical protein